MTGEKTKVSVRFFGEEYTLVGQGNAEYIRELARYVDGFITEIKERNPKLTATQAAVLTAVNIADLYFAAKWEPARKGQGEEEQSAG